jgi:hypothetical protein
MSTAARHRQLMGIQKLEEDIDEAAEERGFKLTVRNNGQHWEFARKGCVIDWWPSSGKVAVNKDYANMRRAWERASITAILEANKAAKGGGAVAQREHGAALHANPGRDVDAPAAGQAAGHPALDAFDARHGFARCAAAMSGLRYGTGMYARPVSEPALRDAARLCVEGLLAAPGSFVATGGVRAVRLDSGGVEVRPDGRLETLLKAGAR